jgi:3-dehydroquinate synthase
MPVRLPPLPDRRWDPERLMGHFSRDKKVTDGKIGFILARGIGQVFQCSDVPADLVLAVLTDAVREGSQGGTG